MPKRRPLVSFTFYIRNCAYLLSGFSILLYIGCSTWKPSMIATIATTRKRKKRILRVRYSLSLNADTYLEVSTAFLDRSVAGEQISRPPRLLPTEDSAEDLEEMARALHERYGARPVSGPELNGQVFQVSVQVR